MNELVRYGLGAAAALGVYVAFASHYEKKGAEKAVTRIEKATNNAANLGKAAAAKSAAGGMFPNRRDPTTRD